jgi:2-methylisocitrate lyase-like PEP mutase family enzyme
MRKTAMFQQLIEAAEILIQPGVYDGFSARLVQQMGFECGGISGAGLSETTLGWADVGILSYEANVSRSRDIAACVDIPLSAGAVLLFADALLLKADIALVAKEVSKPLSVNKGFGIRARPTTPLLCARELQDVGVAVASYPRLVTSAAIMGMRNALGVLKQSIEEGRVIKRSEFGVSFQEINDLMGLGTIHDLEQKFLTKDQLASKYGDAGKALAGH